MQTTFNYLLSNHNITLRSLAHRYRWLDTEEDIYHDLLCSVASSLEKYKGNMHNMNSLITLLAKRYLVDRCSDFYDNKHIVFDDLAVEAALNSGVLIEEFEIDARLFMAEVTQLDGLLKQYVDYLMGDSVLTMNRMLASRCKKRLVKRFKAYDPNVPVSEIRA